MPASEARAGRRATRRRGPSPTPDARAQSPWTLSPAPLPSRPCPRWRGWLSMEGDERRVHRLEPERVGVEPGTEPRHDVLVLFVARIGPDPENLLVAEWTARVLRWARAPAVDAEREVVVGLVDPLHRDLVGPPVAEVVLVREASALGQRGELESPLVDSGP